MKLLYILFVFFLISCNTDNKTITNEEIANIIIKDYVDVHYPCRLPPPPKEGVTDYDSVTVEFRKNEICTLCFDSKPVVELDKLNSTNYIINTTSCSYDEDMSLKIWKIYRCSCSNEVFIYFTVTKKYSYTMSFECVFIGKNYTSETISSSVH